MAWLCTFFPADVRSFAIRGFEKCERLDCHYQQKNDGFLFAGQERFGNMTRVYYKEAVGAFIVFDVTRGATLEAVVKWKQDLDSKVQLPDGSSIPCVLLANKCDQQKEGLVNNPTKIDEYCKEKNFAGWFETSAKENINIEEAARFLVNKVIFCGGNLVFFLREDMMDVTFLPSFLRKG